MNRIFACRFRQITDLPCPSCGSTRAVLALLRLDLMRSLRLSPIALVAAAMLAFHAKDAATGDRRRPSPALELVAVVVLALALLRAIMVAAGARTWFTVEHLAPAPEHRQ